MANKKDMLLKTIIFIIGIGIVLFVWFGLQTIDNQAQEIEQLQEEINKKDNTIAYLEEDNESQTEVIEKTASSVIQENIQAFVESTFAVQEGNYEDRKEVADQVLTQRMMRQVFPEEEAYEVMYEYEVSNIKSYVNESESEAGAYVTFEQRTTNVNNNEENDQYITMEVFLQKEGENWLINDFQQLNAESLS
ncbi:hypothetical protein MUN88_20775 [Gracilibacillus caseinilyticus]|uniref:MerR family transcriptional regulator n=1 Tax=Gracilibacillus caseinilyticus TaxID=2932256 RepID=A0ABY4EXT0_9BACI|nr:hypothetical protein [Gracilibacillus caseinilyticus]UOQ48434.1 hypothetical protein MUN88_20775 [Gracilibacillus caseinilyticus]